MTHRQSDPGVAAACAFLAAGLIVAVFCLYAVWQIAGWL
jgi:hypothetical protein